MMTNHVSKMAHSHNSCQNHIRVASHLTNNDLKNLKSYKKWQKKKNYNKMRYQLFKKCT
jgi:hypothetical protein